MRPPSEKRPVVQTEANRRIGARTEVVVPVVVMPAPDGPRGLRRLVSAKLKGRITNVSVSGAEVVTRPAKWIAVRHRVMLGDEHGAALAEIRRVESLGKDKVRFGVIFVEMDPEFEVELHKAAGFRQDDDLAWRWDRGD